MVAAERWRPRQSREHGTARSVRSLTQGSLDGNAASAQLIPKRKSAQEPGGVNTLYVVSDGIAPDVIDEGETPFWLDLGDSC